MLWKFSHWAERYYWRSTVPHNMQYVREENESKNKWINKNDITIISKLNVVLNTTEVTKGHCQDNPLTLKLCRVHYMQPKKNVHSKELTTFEINPYSVFTLFVVVSVHSHWSWVRSTFVLWCFKNSYRSYINSYQTSLSYLVWIHES